MSATLAYLGGRDTSSELSDYEDDWAPFEDDDYEREYFKEGEE